MKGPSSSPQSALRAAQALAPTGLVSCAVAIPLPVRDPFTYTLENGFSQTAKVGSRVLVPFKNREIQGYIVGLSEESATGKLKPVKELIDEEPVLDSVLLKLTKWMSDYYFCSWGEAIENALPKSVKLGKKHADKPDGSAAEVDAKSGFVPAVFELTDEQSLALETVCGLLEAGKYHPLLLHGVTGSGKTEIYIRAIKRALAQGKGAICLVPEIALTTQIRDFFQGHFSGTLEVIHSRLTDRERMLAWLRIRQGKSRVVLGPRSALFAPVQNLGLIIVDEEHENSYKQAETPRYHAREAAKKRAELDNAVLILGSATPSLETMREAAEGRLTKLSLTRRVVNRDLPAVRVIDLKREMEIHRKLSIFSFPLQNEISAALKKKESVLLLLNRRGFATQVQCLGCGEIVQCRHCHVSMTYHQTKRILLCHYCNFQTQLSGKCPACKTESLKYVGWGTEKIESEIARYFPQAVIARLDTDVARRKGAQEKIIDDFRAGKIDILVGTQMIAKGFDFPQVTVVGVVSADVGLSLPDFRSSERTFQLLTQVAGRAGRGSLKGQVIIQTFSPHHHSILFAKDHDYASFYEKESGARRELGFPPFSHLVNLIMHGPLEQEVYKYALELKKQLAEPVCDRFELIGPAPLPFYKLRGHFRWHLMLKGQDVMAMNRELRERLPKVKKPARLKLIVDVDPVSVL